MRIYVIISKRRISGVAVNMPPCHGGDRGFDPHLIRHTTFQEKCRRSSVVELQPSKLITRVRFPSPAPSKPI